MRILSTQPVTSNLANVVFIQHFLHLVLVLCVGLLELIENGNLQTRRQLLTAEKMLPVKQYLSGNISGQKFVRSKGI